LLLKLFKSVLAALIKHKKGIALSKMYKGLYNYFIILNKLLVEVVKT
jgi:hypothetical protein